MAYNVGVTRAKVEAGTAALVYDPTNTPNDLVRECQNMLKALKNNSGAYYYTGAADGKYGTGMKNAVRTFQEENDWACGDADEKIGKKTLAALDIAYADRTNYNAYGSEVSASYLMGSSISETSLLARLIYAENTGSLQAQRNIAHVVYNRKQSSSFPNTYRAVAQQSSQWTTICNGHENARRPPRANSHWQDAVIIAKKLVAGTGLPGNLNSTLTKSQLYAKKNGTEPSSAKDIVRVDGTVFYNL